MADDFEADDFFAREQAALGADAALFGNPIAAAAASSTAAGFGDPDDDFAAFAAAPSPAAPAAAAGFDSFGAFPDIAPASPPYGGSPPVTAAVVEPEPV
ncbi:hypothetical protein HK405_001822, partial [Cladochytrium tenue]